MQLKKIKQLLSWLSKIYKKLLGERYLVSIVVLQIVIIHLRISSTDSQTVTKIC